MRAETSVYYLIYILRSGKWAIANVYTTKEQPPKRTTSAIKNFWVEFKFKEKWETEQSSNITDPN